MLSQSTNQARRGRDRAASQGITGRFVLLPKNVVTGAAKVDIMSRSTHTGRCFLWKATLQAPAQSGLFVLKAPDPPLATTGGDLLAMASSRIGNRSIRSCTIFP